MHLIVGLGNPGEKYQHNRHNIGFLCIEHIASHLAPFSLLWEKDQKSNSVIARIEERFLLVKPQTYMNRSGETVAKLMQRYKLTLKDLTIIHDDLDIKLGDCKFSMGKGPKMHNGLTSIEQRIGTQFRRARLGIENRPPTNSDELRIPGEAYVLSDFTSEELTTLSSVFDRVVQLMSL